MNSFRDREFEGVKVYENVTLCSKLAMKEIETCGYETLVPELCNV